MKIIEIISYQDLYAKLKDRQMPVKIAYKLNKLNAQLATEVAFYQESVQKILNECAQKDEEGNYIPNEDQTGVMIKPELLEECYTKINELQNLKVPIPDITFALDELDCLGITPAELGCLIPLIQE